MSPALVISRREIRTYFNSPVAYIVVTVFSILTGYLFFTQLFIEKQAELRGLFSLMPLLFMFVAPAITMRLLAEEKSTGTLELLITMPVRDWEVVLGKFLAAMALLCVTLGLTVVFAITVRTLGPLDSGPAIGGYLGMVLMGGAYVAIGVMASAFTRNSDRRLHRGVRDLVRALPVRAADPVRPRVAAARLFAFLSIDSHFENISRGVIDTRDVIYYLSVIGVSLLIATLSLESRQWR